MISLSRYFLLDMVLFLFIVNHFLIQLFSKILFHHLIFQQIENCLTHYKWDILKEISLKYWVNDLIFIEYNTILFVIFFNENWNLFYFHTFFFNNIELLNLFLINTLKLFFQIFYNKISISNTSRIHLNFWISLLFWMLNNHSLIFPKY